MKRSLTMDKKEQKLNKLAKLCGLKKSHTLPARTEHDESQKLRGEKSICISKIAVVYVVF